MNGLYIVEYSLDGINKVTTKKTDKSLISFILKNSYQSNFILYAINIYTNGNVSPVTISTNNKGFIIKMQEKGSNTIGFK